MIKKLSPKAVKKANKQYKQERDIVIIAENMSYARNVASLFRIADALHASKVYLTGESTAHLLEKILVKSHEVKKKL